MDARKQPGVTHTTVLQPPGRPHDAAVSAAGNHRWLWAVLAALLLLGLAVIFALPGLIGPVYETTVPAEPLPPGSDSLALRDTAHQTLQSYLQLRARLELETGAKRLPGYPQLTVILPCGNSLRLTGTTRQPSTACSSWLPTVA
jgi:hypothetical protein